MASNHLAQQVPPPAAGYRTSTDHMHMVPPRSPHQQAWQPPPPPGSPPQLPVASQHRSVEQNVAFIAGQVVTMQETLVGFRAKIDSMADEQRAAAERLTMLEGRARSEQALGHDARTPSRSGDARRQVDYSYNDHHYAFGDTPRRGLHFQNLGPPTPRDRIPSGPTSEQNRTSNAYGTSSATGQTQDQSSLLKVINFFRTTHGVFDGEKGHAAQWMTGLIHAMDSFQVDAKQRISVAASLLSGDAKVWCQDLQARMPHMLFQHFPEAHGTTLSELKQRERDTFVGEFLQRFQPPQDVDSIVRHLQSALQVRKLTPQSLMESIRTHGRNCDPPLSQQHTWSILERCLEPDLVEIIKRSKYKEYPNRKAVADVDWLSDEATAAARISPSSLKVSAAAVTPAPPIVAAIANAPSTSNCDQLEQNMRKITHDMVVLKGMFFDNMIQPGYNGATPYPENRGYTQSPAFQSSPRAAPSPSTSSAFPPTPQDPRAFVAERANRRQEHFDPEPARPRDATPQRLVQPPIGATPRSAPPRDSPAPQSLRFADEEMDPPRDQRYTPTPQREPSPTPPPQWSRGAPVSGEKGSPAPTWSQPRAPSRNDYNTGANDRDFSPSTYQGAPSRRYGNGYGNFGSNNQYRQQYRNDHRPAQHTYNTRNAAGRVNAILHQQEEQQLQQDVQLPLPEDYEYRGAGEQGADGYPVGEQYAGQRDEDDQNEQFDPGGATTAVFPIPNHVCVSRSLILQNNPSFTLPAVFTPQVGLDKVISVLVDTGADFQVLRTSLFTALGLDISDYVNRSNLGDFQCYDASGKNMGVVGILRRSLSFQLRATDGTYRTFTIDPFYKTASGFLSATVVCDSCPFQALLGWPMLGHHSFLIDPATLSVRCDGKIYPKSDQRLARKSLSSDDTPRTWDGFAGCATTPLEPFESTLVPVWIPDLVSVMASNEELVFSPDERFMEETGLVFTATTIDRSNPRIFLTNTNAHAVDLSALTYLGTMQRHFHKTVHALNRAEVSTVAANTSTKQGSTTTRTEDVLPKIHDSIPDAYKAQFQALLHEYKDVFHNDFSQHSWDTAPATIDLLPGAKPHHANPYRLPAAHQLAMRALIEKFVAEGVVEASNSPWAAPCFLVPKANGALRFVIDYRVLNSYTNRCHWPLPNIEDLLMQLAGARLFSVFDAHTGFHQMPLDEEARQFTSFITSFGQYRYTRLPMGLANAPSLFMRGMSDFTRDLLNVLVFVDDINIFNGAEAASEQALYTHHLQYLTAFFAKCRLKHLKLNGKKSTIGAPEIDYLGHRINAEGIFPGQAKVDAVQSFATPTSVTNIRTFLGIVNYYRQWIKNCAEIQAPLNNLTRKDVPFVWTQACEQAFQHLKAALTRDCVRSFPHPDLLFHLDTDSSDFAIGAALSQEDGRVLAYFSRSLTGAELNYSVYEKECLAIVAAVTYFRPYLATQKKFIVHTDHRSLATVLKWKNPPRRIARWLSTLTEYSFETVYRPGPQNANADALSRLPSGYVQVPDAELPAKVVCRDGVWIEEGKYDRDDSDHLTAHVSAVGTTHRAAPRNGLAQRAPRARAPRRAHVVTAPPAMAPAPPVAHVPADVPPVNGPLVPVDNVAAQPDVEALRRITAEDLFALYGRTFEDADTGVAYKIADVVFDAACQEYRGLRVGRADHNDPGEWLPIEYFQRHLSSQVLPFQFEYSTDTFRFDAEFRAAVQAELPQLFREHVLHPGDVVYLPDERGQYHYHRRHLDKRTRLLQLQLILPSNDEVARVQAIKTALIRASHDESAHMGVSKTFRRLRQVVFWKGMQKDVAEYIQSCDICEYKGKAADRAHDPQLILRHPLVYRPFQRVSVDLIGPFPKSRVGHKHVVVIVDHFTKWSIAAPIATKEASQVAEVLIQHMYMIFGPAEVLLSDNGGEITANQLNAEIFQRLGSYLTNTTGYHPASNGQVERINKVYKDAIAKYTDDKEHEDWDAFLPLISHSINTSVSTTTGYTPYLLLFGRECRQSVHDLLPKLGTNIKSNSKYADYLMSLNKRLQLMHAITTRNIDTAQSLYNKPSVYHRALHLMEDNEALYGNGQLVLVYTPAVKVNNVKKLSKFWHGPYEVHSRINATTYLISINGMPQPIHVSRLKPHHTRPHKFRTATRPLLH